MRFLVLSDLHIASNTPWAKDYEDLNFTIRELKRMEKPKFDACLICGDTFNSPRISQGDVAKFFELLDVLGVLGKPTGVINGNHDPGSHHVLESLEGVVRLDVEPLMGIVGHSYSQNLDEVQDWLQRQIAQITLTHQSCRAFADLGAFGVPQLLPEYFVTPVNFIGDTHLTACVASEVNMKNSPPLRVGKPPLDIEIVGLAPTPERVGEKYLISPGILTPMRSRTELMSAQPFLMWWEADYRGNGKFDIDNANLETLPVPKRPAAVLEPGKEDRIKVDDSCTAETPMIVYVPEDYENDCLRKDDRVRYIRYASSVDVPENAPVSVELSETTTVDDMVGAASQLLSEEDKDRDVELGLVRSLITTNAPAEIVKEYLEGQNG